MGRVSLGRALCDATASNYLSHRPPHMVYAILVIVYVLSSLFRWAVYFRR